MATDRPVDVQSTFYALLTVQMSRNGLAVFSLLCFCLLSVGIKLHGLYQPKQLLLPPMGNEARVEGSKNDFHLEDFVKHV